MGFDILKWLDDAPVRLVSGVGNPETGGCWMSALSVYSGDTWSDHPDCVCPIVRRLCIRINDMLPSDQARGDVIGPYILEPVGTKTNNQSIVGNRRWHLVDAAIRRFAPYALRKHGLEEHAAILESLPKTTKDNCQEANKACRAAADAADDAAAYAAAVAAAVAARIEFAKTVCIPVVLELCQIGSKVPVEPACSELDIKRSLQVTV